ncbi:MAG TPA: sugar phosphate isomerase/epimerase [Candidatus Acetatifactor stercoripullorum]|uniref:Sugar phosphate isomerase/epimerase n=1 Tax=Candidatus Acetatifactor stercoripullorum TaxID=2838414 RepID=A0A9D1R393_9FIRM|nr:sugar phosphate isomerase/epimerase family protein [uncultured Acetatifactor sp.]HIW80124.1 sugar phosphate isomerase/epimerase [Candidatus Acetatifactor stercoripullorum]
MQLGIRLHDTKKLPLEERIADVHRLGFQCGHLALAKVIDEYPTTDEALTPGFAMYLKNLFARNQVDIAVLGCYLNLANPNRQQLEKTVHRYMAHIRFASLLGCGVVGTETGAPNETYTYVPECHGEEALQTFITNLRPVVRYAEQMGVILAIEPVWKHIVCNPARARRVLDEIASPNLQIILDPVNLLDISNYKEQTAIVEEAVELLGPDVAMVHLKDYVVEDGKLKSVGCGFGQMDYTAVLKFMKERKPFIHATLEDTTPENNLQAKDFILKLYEQA